MLLTMRMQMQMMVNMFSRVNNIDEQLVMVFSCHTGRLFSEPPFDNSNSLFLIQHRFARLSLVQLSNVKIGSFFSFQARPTTLHRILSTGCIKEPTSSLCMIIDIRVRVELIFVYFLRLNYNSPTTSLRTVIVSRASLFSLDSSVGCRILAYVSSLLQLASSQTITTLMLVVHRRRRSRFGPLV